MNVTEMEKVNRMVKHPKMDLKKINIRNMCARKVAHNPKCASLTNIKRTDEFKARKKENTKKSKPLSIRDAHVKSVDLHFTEEDKKWAFLKWDTPTVAEWIKDLGFPQYEACFLKNFIDGKKMMFIEQCTLPRLGIEDYDHIKIISAAVDTLLNRPKVISTRYSTLPLYTKQVAKLKHTTLQCFYYLYPPGLCFPDLTNETTSP